MLSPSKLHDQADRAAKPIKYLSKKAKKVMDKYIKGYISSRWKEWEDRIRDAAKVGCTVCDLPYAYSWGEGNYPEKPAIGIPYEDFAKAVAGEAIARFERLGFKASYEFVRHTGPGPAANAIHIKVSWRQGENEKT